MHEKWTEKEIKVLQENFGKKSKEELMKLLPDRCESGIKMKAKRLRIRKTTKS